MKRSIFIVISLMLTGGLLFSQSVPFVNFLTDARTAGMGNTSVMTTGAYSVRSNSAAMMLNDDNSGEVGLSYLKWQPGIINATNINGAGFYNFGKVGVGAAVVYSTYPASEITNELGSILDEIKPLEMLADLGFAYKINPNLSTGLTLRYILSSFNPEFSSSAFAADLSILYQLEKLQAGLTVTNTGTPIAYDDGKYPLPSRVNAGASYTVFDSDQHSIKGVGSLSYQPVKGYSGLLGGAGAEYSFSDMVFVRAGYHYAGTTVGASFATVGLGVKFNKFKFDAAYLPGPGSNPVSNSIFATFAIGF